MRALFAALAVAYLPGAVWFRLPFWRRSLRARLPAEERAFWAVLLSVMWSLAVVLALASVNVYSFTRLVGVNVALAGIAVLVLQRRLGYAGTAARITAWCLLPVAIVALGAWLYFPSSEYVIGGKDPGTYINEGVQLAERGSLIIRDADVAAVPAEFRGLFFPSYHSPSYYSLRFMGFFVQDPDDGHVVGQFPQLYPASIAIGYSLGGLTGARDAIGAWAILGLLAVYFAGARLFGRVAAGAAVSLLAINVVEVWFARYPNSELAAETLLFAALLAFARTDEDGRGFFGAIAGGLLGLGLFLRYEVLIATFTIGVAAILAPVTRRKVGLVFPAVLAVTSVIGFWYLTGPLRTYAELPLGLTRLYHGWLIACGALALAWLVRLALRRGRIEAFIRRAVPPALAAAVLGLSIYAYFFRHEGGSLAIHDAMAFRTFGWYMTRPGLLAGVAAVTVLIATCFWEDAAFFLTFVAFSLFFFYKLRIVPEHFWAARRFLVVPLPATLLAIGAFADRLIGAPAIRRVRRWMAGTSSMGMARSLAWDAALGAVLVVAAMSPIAVLFWRASTPIRSHVEYAGLIPRLEQLAARIGDRDLVLVESRNAGSDLHVLAVPLAYIYGRHTLVLDSPVPAKRTLDDFIDWARTRYQTIWFLGGGGTDLLSRRIAAIPAASEHFQVPEYDSPMNAYPSGVRRKEFDYGLYRLVPAASVTPGPIDLTIGTLDDLNVVRFHAKEIHAETGDVFRWTRGLSYVLLQGMSPDAHELTIWMSNGGRPRNGPPATVEVTLDNQPLGNATPVDPVQPYSFTLPADLVHRIAAADNPARLSLRVATWNPGELLHADDTRDLGVIVTRVQVR